MAIDVYPITLPHKLDIDKAVAKLQLAVRHYQSQYPQAEITWSQPDPTGFNVTFSLRGNEGKVLARAYDDRVEMSLHVPKGTFVPRSILEAIVRHRATGWMEDSTSNGG